MQDYGLLTTRKEYILINIYTYVAYGLLTVLSVFLRVDGFSLVSIRQPHYQCSYKDIDRLAILQYKYDYDNIIQYILKYDNILYCIYHYYFVRTNNYHCVRTAHVQRNCRNSRIMCEYCIFPCIFGDNTLILQQPKSLKIHSYQE